MFTKKWSGDELYILFNDDTFTLNFDRRGKICEELMECRKHYKNTVIQYLVKPEHQQF